MATQTMDETKTNGITELDLRDVEPRVGQLVGGGQLYDPCSATDIRRRATGGSAIRYLTPDAVVSYIGAHGLYRC